MVHKCRGRMCLLFPGEYTEADYLFEKSSLGYFSTIAERII